MASEERWQGDWGTNYAQFFVLEPEALDEHWRKTWERGRIELVRRALADIPKETGILEVGCGTGNQLRLLRSLGWRDLTGLDINQWAVDKSKERGFNATVGTALKLPYRPQSFDLVLTCGVLSHIEPERVGAAVSEILRVAKRWVWVTEYSNNSGNGEFVWPADWEAVFQKADPALEVQGEPVLLESIGAGNLKSTLFERRGEK